MFVSTIRKKNKCYEHTAFSYKHIPICYNEIGSELLVKGCPSPANTDEQGKVKGERLSPEATPLPIFFSESCKQVLQGKFMSVRIGCPLQIQ